MLGAGEAAVDRTGAEAAFHLCVCLGFCHSVGSVTCLSLFSECVGVGGAMGRLAAVELLACIWDLPGSFKLTLGTLAAFLEMLDISKHEQAKQEGQGGFSRQAPSQAWWHGA